LNEDDAAAKLLRVALGRPETEVPDSTVGPDCEDWEAWLWLARVQRVVPLLYRLVDTIATNLTDAQREDIRQVQGATLSRCVQLEHHLVAVSGLLAEHGVRSAVLKGGATAHLDYPDPAWREVSDIDLLVDPEQRSTAVALLAAEGWVQGYALPAHHEQFTHAVTLVLDGMELDLHQRIARRALGLRVPAQDLLDSAVPFDIAGVQIRALDDVDRTIHAALHMTAARGLDRSLSSIADVLLTTDRRPHLSATVLARAEKWRVRPLVETAVRDAYAAAQLDLPPAWTEAVRRPIRRRDRLVEQAYLRDVRSPILMELAYLRLMKGWRRRWDYLRGYFTTDVEYASQHGRSGFRAQARYVLSKLGLRRP
jgi:hypothetical protein